MQGAGCKMLDAGCWMLDHTCPRRRLRLPTRGWLGEAYERRGQWQPAGAAISGRGRSSDRVQSDTIIWQGVGVRSPLPLYSFSPLRWNGWVVEGVTSITLVQEGVSDCQLEDGWGRHTTSVGGSGSRQGQRSTAAAGAATESSPNGSESSIHDFGLSKRQVMART